MSPHSTPSSLRPYRLLGFSLIAAAFLFGSPSAARGQVEREEPTESARPASEADATPRDPAPEPPAAENSPEAEASAAAPPAAEENGESPAATAEEEVIAEPTALSEEEAARLEEEAELADRFRDSPQPEGGPVDSVRFTFQGAEWPEVLQQIADWADLKLDMTDVPPGQFSYFDNRQHTPTEAIDTLNGYLLPRGYALIRRDNFLVVLKTDNEMLATLVPTVRIDELVGRGENELLRVVVPLTDLSPSAAAEEVRGLLGPLGDATPLDSSRSLVIQGFGNNLRQAIELLEGAIPEASDDKLDFRAFPLRHMAASEAELQVRNLFGLGSGVTNVSGARSSVERAIAYRERARRGDDKKNDKNAAPDPIPLLEKVARNMKISAMSRTNSLLVTATPAGLALVEEVLQSIDVPQDEQQQQAYDDSRRELRVYTVHEASEGEVAKTLDVVIPGVVVNEDSRQDAIHVLATPREHREVEALIRTLDNNGRRSGTSVEVIPVRRYDVDAMSELLLRLFENESRSRRPVIEAEPLTRTLIVRGTDDQIAQVRGMLEAYGEGGAETASTARSKIRTVAVHGGRGEAVVRATQEVIAPRGRSGRSIRIVVPGQREAAEPERTGPTRIGEEKPEHRRASDDRRGVDDREISQVNPEKIRLVSLDRSSPDEAAESDTDVRTPRRPRRSDAEDSQRTPQVHVEMRGDQLLLYSSDVDALDEVEEMMRELAQQMPGRTDWTVFYLQAAEAEPLASRLYDLVLDETLPARPARGLAAGSNGTSDATELRIVPDSRTNALFVSGTAEQVAHVEELLELLDAVELPESYRERVPRPIPVQYANVNDVAEVIRELYKDYLTDPAAQQRENDRRSSDRNRSRNTRNTSAAQQQSPGVRLTLAVDAQASELLVSCNETLYREIRKLVEQRDLAAQQTRPTTSIMHVGSALPVELDEILQSMSTKITATVVESEEESNRSSQRRGRDRRRR